MDKTVAAIKDGKTVLGIELGSTRIKSVLIGEDYAPIASGSFAWENKLEHGVWTYSLEEAWKGLQESFKALRSTVESKYKTTLKTVGAIGFSGMMHGYLVFDKDGKQLAPFRTWRNTITGQAAEELTELFQFNIPQRWSVAHLYQTMLNGEGHIPEIAYQTTLAGYIHWKLSGKKVMGIGEASGMFPIDSTTFDYDAAMVKKFNKLLQKKRVPWKLEDILPQVLVAGESGGALTKEGAILLDPSGTLQAGIPLCPPEGDVGTGMVATNSVGERTCNISAGTSVFAMIILEKMIKTVYPEIDVVTTPAGKSAAMVHSNKCTSDLNAWVGVFREFTDLLGTELDENGLFELLYKEGLKGDADCGGLLAYNYFSGEHITHFTEGRPLFARTPVSHFTLANFMRTHLYSALGALRIGLDILFDQEEVRVSRVLGHGGFFKTEGVGQRVMAAAMKAPVSVMETAGEGGAWGIALLAFYMLQKDADETLETYLDEKVFAGKTGTSVAPEAADIAGFAAFMERYKAGLPIERAAIENLTHKE